MPPEPQPRIVKPLVVSPQNLRGIVDSVKLPGRLMAGLRRLTRQMHIVRPANGESPAGALVQAIAEGRCGVVRLDDPERRVFVVGDEKGTDGSDGTDAAEVRGKRKLTRHWWERD